MARTDWINETSPASAGKTDCAMNSDNRAARHAGAACALAGKNRIANLKIFMVFKNRPCSLSKLDFEKNELLVLDLKRRSTTAGGFEPARRQARQAPVRDKAVPELCRYFGRLFETLINALKSQRNGTVRRDVQKP
jgi:hypothetical protein